jgi:pimeloyl-ACP methyl ester carboxylesterase
MSPHKQTIIPKQFVGQLNINHMNGRIVHIPNKNKSREQLFVYGHHGSLERVYGILEDLSQYGPVTAPDLPGFGGMDSLYKIGDEPSIDNLADYLAAVIKLRYQKRRFTIIGFSIGFAVTTRMLQKYPELADQVEDVISVTGFTNKTDFKLSPSTLRLYKWIAVTFSSNWTAKIFRYLFLNSFVLKTAYRYTPNARHKFKGMPKEEFKKMIQFEVELWQCNDVRTYMRTGVSMLTLDLSRWKVAKRVRHISVGDADQYFDDAAVARNMKQIYKSFRASRAEMKNHAPSVIASKEESSPIVPKDIRKLLNTRPK